MSTHLTFRELSIDDLPSMADIDRAETIDATYTAANGQLSLQETRIDVHGWYPTEVPDHVEQISMSIVGGGAAFGAHDGDRLVGIIGLRIDAIGGDPALMQLEPLHVSAPYRNQGIGKQLTSMVVERARSLGAGALYISATPTRNSVDAYLRMGARPTATPDPHLFTKEPEDIHLILRLEDFGVSGGSERAG